MKNLKKKKYKSPNNSTLRLGASFLVKGYLAEFFSPELKHIYGNLDHLKGIKTGFLIADNTLEQAFDKVMTGAHQIHVSEPSAIPTVCISFAMSMLVKDGHVTHEEAVALAQAFEFFNVTPGSI